jgi:nucleoid DNA-binding protein
VNKTELVSAIAEGAGLTKKQAEGALEVVLNSVISEAKAGSKTTIPGFGTFHPTKRAARMGVNPRTGEKRKIAASKGVRFAAGATFKDILNGRKPAPKAKKK